MTRTTPSFRSKLPLLIRTVAISFLGTAATACALEPIDEAAAEEEAVADGDEEGTADESITGSEPMDESSVEPMDESSVEAAGSRFAFHAIEPCMSASRYTPRESVQFGLSHAPFTPPCVKLNAGGVVVFQGSFLDHPLVPRSGGHTPTPIQSTSQGGWAEFEFWDYGFFPYQCALHPNERGVIWITLL